MAIIVEDGTGLADAQCYCSLEYLDAYLEERGLEHDHSDADKERALVIAAKDWIDGYHTFNSEKLVSTQALKFPTEDDGLPADILLANAKAAHLYLHDLLLVDLSLVSTSGEVESESKSIGTLSKSTSYRAGTAQRYSRVLPRDLTNLLQPYLYAGSGTTLRL
jgi:hypothetical protein